MSRVIFVRLSWWIFGLAIIGTVALGTIVGHMFYYLVVLEHLP